MSHVDFKKWSCHPVEFKGQRPPYYSYCKTWYQLGRNVSQRLLTADVVAAADDAQVGEQPVHLYFDPQHAL